MTTNCFYCHEPIISVDNPSTILQQQELVLSHLSVCKRKLEITKLTKLEVLIIMCMPILESCNCLGGKGSRERHEIVNQLKSLLKT